MDWYTQTDTDVSIGWSLLVAQANLLQHWECNYTLNDLVTTLNPNNGGLDWWTITRLPGVKLEERFNDSSFPHSNDAIIQLKRFSSVDGLVDHYCKVDDWQSQTIVDSLDGKVKPVSTYGMPYGWAGYSKIPVPEPEKLPANTQKKPEYWYKLLPGENIWNVAIKLMIPAETLIEHNDIEDPSTVKPGDSIHLPTPRNLNVIEAISYKLLDEPQQMHVTKPGGTKKVAFGNKRTWLELDDSKTGPTYAEDYNVTIVMEAYVPVEGEVAKYLMNSTEAGNYLQTGRVASTVGFNHSHLSDGHVSKPKPTPPPPPEPLPVFDISPAKPAPTVQTIDMVIVRQQAQQAVLQPQTPPHAQADDLEDIELFAEPSLYERTIKAVDPKTGKLTNGGRLTWDERIIERTVAHYTWISNRLRRKQKSKEK